MFAYNLPYCFPANGAVKHHHRHHTFTASIGWGPTLLLVFPLSLVLDVIRASGGEPLALTSANRSAGLSPLSITVCWPQVHLPLRTLPLVEAVVLWGPVALVGRIHQLAAQYGGILC